MPCDAIGLHSVSYDRSLDASVGTCAYILALAMDHILSLVTVVA